MIWVLVVGGAVLVLLVALVLWGVWLFHRAQDLWSQTEVLGRRVGQLAGLLEQLQVAPSQSNLDAVRERTRDARRTAG